MARNSLSVVVVNINFQNATAKADAEMRHGQPLGKDILLVSYDSDAGADALCALQKQGHRVCSVTFAAFDGLAGVEAKHPDVLILIVVNISQSLLQQLHMLQEHCPLPVIVFARTHCSAVAKKAAKAGVIALIVDLDVQIPRLQSILDIAVARFEEQQSLRTALEKSQQQLSQRKLIERAKGLLMAAGLSEEQAFKRLRSSAMSRGETLVCVAQRILKAGNV